MAGFRSVGAVADAYTEGRVHTCSFRKIATPSTTNWWYDLSLSAGNPKPQYYFNTPLTAQTLEGYDGIFHGADKAPATMYLSTLGLVTSSGNAIGRYVLLDYLLYYTGIDGDEVGVQLLDNTTPLPRYADGSGVQAMAVFAAPSAGGGAFTFEYVNQDGVTRTSPSHLCSLAIGATASIVTTQPGMTGAAGGPFLHLASGDTGIRRINSVTFSAASGGVLAFVLVRPLADLAICEANTVVEFVCAQNRPLIQIEDGAYLNLICLAAGNISGAAIVGYATFVWST